MATNPASVVQMATAQNIKWPPIPAWEISSLQQLAAQNRLSGVPPQILAVIALAESGGEANGAGVNSSGYGGYFGLGTGTYPGGAVTKTQLETNSPDSFAAQAVVAASAFAGMLQTAGGNPVQAEQVYQTGKSTGTPSSGARLMSQYVGGTTVDPSTLTVSGGSSTAAGTAGNPACLVGFPGVGGVGSFCLVNAAQAQEVLGAALMVAGGLVLFVGVGLALAGLGGRKVSAPVALVLGEVQGRRSATRRAQAASQSQEDRLELIAARGQEKRAIGTPRASKDLGEPFPE